MADIRTIFCANLADLMLRDNVTQEALAEAIEVSQAAVSDWLARKSMPRSDRLERIAKFFRTTVPALLSEKGYELSERTKAAWEAFSRMAPDDPRRKAIEVLLGIEPTQETGS